MTIYISRLNWLTQQETKEPRLYHCILYRGQHIDMWCYTVPSVSLSSVWYGRKSIWIQEKHQNRTFHALQGWQVARVRGEMQGEKLFSGKKTKQT